ncbi:MAG: SDR family NAD(P)-dependent oxidoreductase, partial [Mycobacteriales bacterium]
MQLESPFRLDGKVALVSGGSYGLGATFATVLAQAGADVVITARSKDKLAATAAEVARVGRRCLAVPGDVTDFADCAAVVEAAVAEFGHIDVLVNNAGWADDRLVRTENVEPETFHKMVMTDQVGLFYLT